jgi:aromatic-L-amino-acid decarboxylase
MLTAALDANGMLWKSCPAATELEQVTTAWMLDWIGLPKNWFGMILDSASAGVLQAIVAARQRAEPESRAAGPSGQLVAYVSEQTHSSVEKAAITAGIGQRTCATSPWTTNSACALARSPKRSSVTSPVA